MKKTLAVIGFVALALVWINWIGPRVSGTDEFLEPGEVHAFTLQPKEEREHGALLFNEVRLNTDDPIAFWICPVLDYKRQECFQQQGPGAFNVNYQEIRKRTGLGRLYAMIKAQNPNAQIVSYTIEEVLSD